MRPSADRTGGQLVQRSTDSSTPPHAGRLRSCRQPLDSDWTHLARLGRAISFTPECTRCPIQLLSNRVGERIGNRPDIKAAVNRLVPHAVGSGLTERHWDELLPCPRELPPRLRLFVAGGWRNLNHPSPEIRQAVHTAFAGGGTARSPSVVLGRRDRRPGDHRLTQPVTSRKPITSREGDTRMSTTPQMSHMGQQQGQQFPQIRKL